MDSRHCKMKMNAEGDRFSSLPVDLIHKILSFVGIKDAIKMSGLSSRWRYIWTFMPSLNLSIQDFNTMPEFSKFVKHVLSARNNQTDVHSVKLAFRGKVTQVSIKRLLDYAFSHNVQRLNVTFLPQKKMEFPLSLFSSRSLKHLTLTWYAYGYSIMIPPTWELPSLATLTLDCFDLYDDNSDRCVSLFSNCENLKNLTLKNCTMMGGLNGFNICHPGLSSLTLDTVRNGVNVVTPQLKNLNIKYGYGRRLISAPNVSFLHYKVTNDSLDLSADFLHLEKVDICIKCPYKDNGRSHDKIVDILQQMRSVKFLTLNLEIIKVLSLSPELISHQPSPFVNLQSLRVYPDYVNPEAPQTQPDVTMSTEVKNFLLDSAPGATVTMVSYNEIRAVMNVTLARSLMSDLQVLLDRWKKNNETETAHMKQDKPPMEGHTATVHEQVEVEVENSMTQPDTNMRWNFGGRMTHIKSYWQDMNDQLEKGYKNTSSIISMVQKIGVLPKLPTSLMVKMQARFYCMCAEAETIMDNMMDRMKIQCDKGPSHSNVYSDELAA